jgi:hypothetical protein
MSQFDNTSIGLIIAIVVVLILILKGTSSNKSDVKSGMSSYGPENIKLRSGMSSYGPENIKLRSGMSSYGPENIKLRSGMSSYGPENIKLRSGMKSGMETNVWSNTDFENYSGMPAGVEDWGSLEVPLGYTDKPLNIGNDLSTKIVGMNELEQSVLADSLDNKMEDNTRWISSAEIQIDEKELTPDDVILNRSMFGQELTNYRLGFTAASCSSLPESTSSNTLSLTDYGPEYGPAKGNVTT